MTNGQAIVVTGASTGIGKATALHLDRLGFTVFAGVRKETDAQALREEASDSLIPINLDVTDGGAIAIAVDTVAKATGMRYTDWSTTLAFHSMAPWNLCRFQR